MKMKIEHFGNRRSCLEGCGAFVMQGRGICRNCKRKNQRRLAKDELRERKAKQARVN